MTFKNRREFLSGAVAGAAGLSAVASLGGCSADPVGQLTPATVVPGEPMPWINWAGTAHCYPSQVLAPASEAALIEAVAGASGTLRPAGASHAFSALVPTDDTLISTDLMSGMVSHDSHNHRAELWGGTRLHDLCRLLDGVNQAVPNLPDMNYPSLAGAMATSTHGTGEQFGSISSFVDGVALVTPAGELLECSASKNPELFQAVRTNLGALGVVSRVSLQNIPAFNLTEASNIEKTADVFEDLDRRFRDNRHFEFFPMPHTAYSLVTCTNLAAEGDVNSGEEDPYILNPMKRLFDFVSWVPGMGPELYERILLSQFATDDVATLRTGPSFEVFAHDRLVRFREMEYSVPVELGPICLKEILDTISAKNLPVNYPMEYRHVKADDIWLSMYEGRDSAAISFHQYADRDYQKLFAEIEPIFWKYEGRPHWGKIHTLEAEKLAQLYPRHWQHFQELRRELDPKGKMLNSYLEKLLLRSA